MKNKLYPSILIIFFLSVVNLSHAQKIKDEQLNTILYYKAKLNFSPKYNSFKTEYDYGDFIGKKPQQPLIGKLSYNADNPDLLVKIIVKNQYVTGKELKTQKGDHNTIYYYYHVNYKADYGHIITDLKTNTELINSMREDGDINTESFNSSQDLDQYMKNAFIPRMIPFLVNTIQNEFLHLYGDNKLDASFSINPITGDSKDYDEINKATADFTKIAADSTANPELLIPAMAVWEKYLAQANFEDKKSEINEKAADALLANLCAGFVLIENYAKLKETAEIYKSHHKGVFAKPLTFKFYPNGVYNGPRSQLETSFGKMFSKGKYDHWFTIEYLALADYELKLNEKIVTLNK